MANVKIVLDGSSAAWMEVFQNSQEIREGLAKYASIAASKNTSALQSSSVKGLEPEYGFVAIVEKADKTLLGKVVANSGKAKAAAIRAGLPHW